MKLILLSLMMAFSFLVQINDAQAKKYRTIKAKKAYSYSQDSVYKQNNKDVNKKALIGTAAGALAGGMLASNLNQEEDCDLEDVLSAECSAEDFDGLDYSDYLMIIGFIFAIFVFIKHKRHTAVAKK